MRDTPLDHQAEALHEALVELARAYQFRDRDTICCHDVSVTQCYALDVLVREGPRTLNQLAGGLHLDKSTASLVVKVLERKGYVARTPHPSDGRSILVAPTAAGRKLFERIKSSLVAERRTMIEDFPPEVREGAIELVRRLASSVRTRSTPARRAA